MIDAVNPADDVHILAGDRFSETDAVTLESRAPRRRAGASKGAGFGGARGKRASGKSLSADGGNISRANQHRVFGKHNDRSPRVPELDRTEDGQPTRLSQSRRFAGPFGSSWQKRSLPVSEVTAFAATIVLGHVQ